MISLKQQRQSVSAIQRLKATGALSVATGILLAAAMMPAQGQTLNATGTTCNGVGGAASPGCIAAHLFSGPDGSGTFGGVTLGSNGHLYGMTTQGGVSNEGVVYELTPPKKAG